MALNYGNRSRYVIEKVFTPPPINGANERILDPGIWPAGMIGIIPVFKNKKKAIKYAKRNGIDKTDVYILVKID